ncbi:enoyl-CoA hydratase/isomerase family protein [Chloroflexota bacterium]
MTRDYSAYKNYKVEVDEDGVATVTINRPEVLNAQNMESRIELHRIWPDLGQDEDVKVIILTGAGRGFCAGGDIKEVASRHAKGLGTGPGVRHPTGDPQVTETEVSQPGSEIELHRIWSDRGGAQGVGLHYTELMLNLNKPIIGAINGVATGQGCVMALYCDIVIAADTASFGDHHVRVGLAAGDGLAVIWPLLVGPHKAMEYLMTGDLMDAQEAHRLGLVNKVVPLAELMPTAKALAKRLAHGPTIAINFVKSAVNKKVLRDYNLTWMFALHGEIRTMFTEDHLEGASAFAEKREPQFKGR